MSNEEDLQCSQWPSLPFQQWRATGGLLGNTPVVCGGEKNDECYSMTQRDVKLITRMSFKRKDAASIVINDTILWVTGGESNEFEVLSSSEYITFNSSSPGPDLPFQIDGHEMISVNLVKNIDCTHQNKETL